MNNIFLGRKSFFFNASHFLLNASRFCLGTSQFSCVFDTKTSLRVIITPNIYVELVKILNESFINKYFNFNHKIAEAFKNYTHLQ